MLYHQVTRPVEQPSIHDLEVVAGHAHLNRDANPDMWRDCRRTAEAVVANNPELARQYREASLELHLLFKVINPDGSGQWPYGHAFDAYVDAVLAVITWNRIPRAVTRVLAWPWTVRYGHIPIPEPGRPAA